MKYEKIDYYVSKAYKNVALYINSVEDPLKVRHIKDAPIITKSKYMEHQDAGISPEYYMDFSRGRLMSTRTSGSMGTYLQIVWSKDDYYHSMMELWMRRIKYYDIYPSMRLAYFFTDDRICDSDLYIYRRQELAISNRALLPDSIEDMYRYLLEWNPEWMLIQPSIATLLCQYIRQNNRESPGSLRYVEFSGELLTDEVRALVQDTLKCTTANQYGTNEVNSIAYECPYKNMHIMTSNVHVEIVDEQGKVINDSMETTDDDSEGRIIITSLSNNAMPFIRYDVGDVGNICSKKCNCGNRNPILNLAGGRCNDYVYIDEIKRISPYIFVGILDKLNNLLEGAVLQFNIEQNDYSEFTVTLYSNGDYSDDEISEAFLECIDNEYLANARYNFVYTTNIITNGINGKYAYFRNRIKENNVR